MKTTPPLTVPSLNEGEVHVWPARLNLPPSEVAQFSHLLSSDERDRARRFHFRRDRDRFVVGRGMLRTLLGTYLEIAPKKLRFRYTQYGRPVLAGSSVSFNVSHSGEHALFAVSPPGFQVGVDVEILRRKPAEEEVAEQFFAVAEVEALRRLPRAAQPEAFLRCWTRKEAFVKARGDGLSLSLQDFEVTLRPDQQPRLVRTAWSRREPAEWRMYDLSSLYPECIAAAAVRWAAEDVRLIVKRELCKRFPHDRHNERSRHEYGRN